MNPKHLAWGSYAENQADKVKHGRQPRGEGSHLAKLTADEVAEIIRRKGASTQRELAAEFGVAQQTISRIQTGKRWAHMNGVELTETIKGGFLELQERAA